MRDFQGNHGYFDSTIKDNAGWFWIYKDVELSRWGDIAKSHSSTHYGDALNFGKDIWKSFNQNG